jgi:hypothetical protein
VKNETNDKWYITVGEPYIDYIVFTASTRKKTKEINTGLLRNFNNVPLKEIWFVLPLDLDQNEEKTYFIRAKATPSILKCRWRSAPCKPISRPLTMKILQMASISD